MRRGNILGPLIKRREVPWLPPYGEETCLRNCGFLHLKTLRTAGYSFLGGRKRPAVLCCTPSGEKRERN